LSAVFASLTNGLDDDDDEEEEEEKYGLLGE